MRYLLLCLIAAVALITSAPAPTAHAATAEVAVHHSWETPASAATTWAAHRRGRVGFAVVDHRGRIVAGRNLHRTFNSASVFKAMLLVCHLNDERVRTRALTRIERDQLAAMIRRSADAPANRFWGLVRTRCLYRLAARSGMRGFRTGPFWGRTRITPAGTATLFFHIDGWIAPRHRSYATRLLATVVPSQRWGLARRGIVPDGMRIRFKGGFAGTPGGGRTVSQGALFVGHGHRIAVAVLTNHSPSQRYGEATLEGVGARLLRGYPGTVSLRAR